MELTETKLKTTAVKAEKQIQITLDKDKNVPDTKMDIEKIILAKGNIKLREIEVMVDRIRVIGELKGEILYSGADREKRCNVMDFSIDFEEYFHIASVVPTDHVSVIPELEDLNVTLINSRKVGIRSILNFFIEVTNVQEIDAIADAEGEGVQTLHKNLSMTQMAVDKKDMVRLKEEVVLPANKPNIYELLWNHLELQKVESKIYDHKIEIRGELYLFLLYLGEEDVMPLQFAEWELPVKAELECAECMEDMIGNIGYRIVSRNLEVKPDIDGETRVISAEIGLELDLKIYEEKQLQVLEDIYHWKKELIPYYENFLFQHLIAKNAARMKLNHRIRLTQKQGKILQILYMDGTCKVDETEIVKNGVRVEGVLDGVVLYLMSDDNTPIGSMSVVVPFSYTIEAKGIDETDHYRIHAVLDRLSAGFIDGDELEIKAEITFDMIVLSPQNGKAMTRIEEKDLDLKKLQQMPGIIGYIVRPGDTLWNIAKKYYTTIDSILALNEEISGEIQPGERLLIMKEIEESLDG
jgi:hypothetical protein